MSELTDRLRKGCINRGVISYKNKTDELMARAADEIDRLSADLVKIKNWYHTDSSVGGLENLIEEVFGDE